MKLPKSAALYTFHPGEQYTCSSCMMLKEREKGKGCAWFGPQYAVNEQIGSCGYYAHGDYKKFNIPWIGIFTPIQLGYMENRPGFTCARCDEFKVPNDCEKVDKDSPGDTPGEISPKACCSIWERSPKRGGLSNEALVQILAHKPVESLKAAAGVKKR